MYPPQRSRGLSQAIGLSSLADVQKQVDMDARRTGANIALNKSMTAWMYHKANSVGDKDNRDDDEDSESPRSARGKSNPSPPESAPPDAFLLNSPVKRLSTFDASRCPPISGTINRGVSLWQSFSEDSIASLEEAYKAHAAAFDIDGDNRISVEELIVILNRCRLFDQFFTPSKVRNHFATWADGCNQSCLTRPLGDDGIGFPEFQFVLQWASDVKCVDLEHCAQKVIRLSSKLCDKEASVQRRLEVVFDGFCKQDPVRMSAFEFGNLCKKLGVPFCMGDVFLIFGQQSGGLQQGVVFQDWIEVLREVGKKLGVGEEVFATFARAVEFVNTDDTTLSRIRLRLRQAAGIVGGQDWQKFLRECDADNSGTLDWEEFLAICRDKLHLADRDSHLRILFERLDLDASGDISIKSMIDFMTSGTVGG